MPTGLDGDKEYVVRITYPEGQILETHCPQERGLKYTVTKLLEGINGEIPDHLTEQERETIQGILDA